MQLTHNEIENLLFYTTQDNVCMVARKDAKHLGYPSTSVFGADCKTDMQFCHLLASAPLMYQSLTLLTQGLDTMIEADSYIPQEDRSEANDRMLAHLIALQQIALQAQKVAQVGIIEASK